MTVLLADAYLHQLDPFIFRITETFGPRWYGLSYAIGFLIAWAIMRWFASTRRSPIGVQDAGDLMFYAIVGVLVGGRLGYALFYAPIIGTEQEPSILFGFSSDFPWWNLLALTKGGMASHGGVAGFIIACCVFGMRRGFPKLHLLDLGALACAPGLALGRLANFVNGELWGRPLPASMQTSPPWWSIKYPEEVPAVWAKAPSEYVAQLDAIEPLRAVVGGGDRFYRTVHEVAYDADATGHAEVVATIEPLLTAHYPSQFLQAFTDGPLLIALVALVWWKPRRPGVVGAWFLIGYGVMRITTEVFREPDAGVSFILGLTRGQFLSVLMIVAGLVGLPLCARRPVDALGGLRAPG